MTAAQDRTGRPWTPADDARLRVLHGDGQHTVAEIARLFERTEASIKSRLYTLRIGRRGRKNHGMTARLAADQARQARIKAMAERVGRGERLFERTK